MKLMHKYLTNRLLEETSTSILACIGRIGCVMLQRSKKNKFGYSYNTGETA